MGLMRTAVELGAEEEALWSGGFGYTEAQEDGDTLMVLTEEQAGDQQRIQQEVRRVRDGIPRRLITLLNVAEARLSEDPALSEEEFRRQLAEVSKQVNAILGSLKGIEAR